MKEKMNMILLVLIYLIPILLVVFLIAFSIYIWVKYGNLPPDEVPSWVHWWMMRR